MDASYHKGHEFDLCCRKHRTLAFGHPKKSKGGHEYYYAIGFIAPVGRLIGGSRGRAMCGNTKERCMPTSRSSSPIFWHGGCVVDFPTTPINLAQVRLIQMQLSSQIIEESCDSYPDLLLHARIPVLARPHARGASCGELQLEACRGSRSSSSNSSPVGSERSCRVSAVYMHREPSARAASHVGSVPV